MKSWRGKEGESKVGVIEKVEEQEKEVKVWNLGGRKKKSIKKFS